MPTKGSCNCGSVAWSVEGALEEVRACHCNQCRKQSGSFYTATRVGDAELTVSGDDNITWYEASKSAKRGFCKHCGSAMFWKRNNADHTSILAGSIDGESGLKIAKHIFVADKGDYYELDDGIPQQE